MKKVYSLLILSAFITLLFTACDKVDKCKGIYTGTPPTHTTLEFRDNQGRDLLNPATPGHYDTAQIKVLNGPSVRVLQSTADGTIAKDRIFLSKVLYSNSAPYQIRLSTTLTDEIKATFKELSCQTSTLLVTFSYNGTSYPVTTAQHFIIIKP